MWHLEDKNHITPEQAAFRQDRSTEDQITHIYQAIYDAFQDKKHTLEIWINVEKALGKMRKEDLKLKLCQCGVAVECTNGLDSTWTTGKQKSGKENITTARYKLQQAIQKIETWAWSWLVKVDEKKLTVAVFSFSNQQQKVCLKLNGQDTLRYFGVTLNRRLTWKNSPRATSRLTWKNSPRATRAEQRLC